MPRAGVDDPRAEQRFQAESEALRFLRRHRPRLSWIAGAGVGAARQAALCRMLSSPPKRPAMATRVFVDGQEGTTGLRIHEYLARRSDVEVLRAAPELRKDAAERARLLNAADVAFLCLPDAAAREAAALVTNPATCLIDASTAHRTASDWVFGLPELARRSARAHPRLEADRQSGLPLDRLHPARASARRRRAGRRRRRCSARRRSPAIPAAARR